MYTAGRVFAVKARGAESWGRFWRNFRRRDDEGWSQDDTASTHPRSDKHRHEALRNVLVQTVTFYLDRDNNINNEISLSKSIFSAKRLE